MGRVVNIPGLFLLPFVVAGTAIILHMFKLDVVLYLRMFICTYVLISDYKGFLSLEVK